MTDDVRIIHGDCLDVLPSFAVLEPRPSLVVTDPPYAFGGDGAEHAISATVAIGLRETARLLEDGGWMLIFCASSWRSTAYMAEAVRGIVTPVRIGHWLKPKARAKVKTPGWQWASVNVLACRKGKSSRPPTDWLDHITCPPVTVGRRAELPAEVADWAVGPFASPGGTFLDPFSGSGALVKAAARAGMRAFGIERGTGSDEEGEGR